MEAARAAQIGLADAAEIPLLREIERRAATLFRAHPRTAELTLRDTPASAFLKAQKAGLLWVARVGSEAVGFALVEPLGSSLHLEELDVAPEHGRRGIGRTLVRTVCKASSARSLPVTLRTFTEVPWNAPFYERLGFRRLPPGQLPAALRERVREEAQRGMSPAIRVTLQFDGPTRPGGDTPRPGGRDGEK